MAVRFRAHLRYVVGSGYAQWAYDQMQNRLIQAFSLREGSINEELSHATRDIITNDPEVDSRENITINVFWPDDREDLAVDTRDTLLATTPWMRTDDVFSPSWMDWHYCNHDQEGTPSCPEPEWVWSA